jgi:hypothetical protein
MTGAGEWVRLRRRYAWLPLVAFLMLWTGAAWTTHADEIPVKPKVNVEDKDNIENPDSKVWVLDFKFVAPRLITVDIPGRGRKLCWYMRYQVINNTKEPRTFYPDFELVTLDKPGVFHDQVLLSVQEAIRRVEDPTGFMDIKNSVTIASKPIPTSKPEAAPKVVNGVAIWDDVNPDANRFSIFVSGLSNGVSLAEIPPDNKQIVRKKTLQLNFKRLGDRYYQHSGEIRFVPPAEWIYRATNIVVENGKASTAPSKKTTPTPPEKNPPSR